MNHGTSRAYTHGGCRCEKCRIAQAAYRKQLKAAKLNQEVPAEQHGTLNGYNYWNCSCDECRSAKATVQQNRVLRLLQQPVPTHVHGTTNGYSNYGCRCDLCKGAKYRPPKGLPQTPSIQASAAKGARDHERLHKLWLPM